MPLSSALLMLFGPLVTYSLESLLYLNPPDLFAAQSTGCYRTFAVLLVSVHLVLLCSSKSTPAFFGKLHTQRRSPRPLYFHAFIFGRINQATTSTVRPRLRIFHHAVLREFKCKLPVLSVSNSPSIERFPLSPPGEYIGRVTVYLTDFTMCSRVRRRAIHCLFPILV